MSEIELKLKIIAVLGESFPPELAEIKANEILKIIKNGN
jgi:hypothetical protein